MNIKEMKREIEQRFEIAKGVGGLLGQVTYALWTLARRPEPEQPRVSLTRKICADPAGYAAMHQKLIMRFNARAQRAGELRTENNRLRGALRDAEKLVGDLRMQRDQFRKLSREAHERADKLEGEDAAALDGLKTSLGNGVQSQRAGGAVATQHVGTMLPKEG